MNNLGTVSRDPTRSQVLAFLLDIAPNPITELELSAEFGADSWQEPLASLILLGLVAQEPGSVPSYTPVGLKRHWRWSRAAGRPPYQSTRTAYPAIPPSLPFDSPSPNP